MKNGCITNLFLLLLCVSGILAVNRWHEYMAGPETDAGKTCKVETRAFVTSELSVAACAYRCNKHGNCATMFNSPSTKVCHGCLGEFGNLESDREELPGSFPYSVKCEPGWIRYMGHCYYFGTENMDYQTAWDFCISNGSQIVYIESSGELQFVKEEMIKADGERYWNSLYQDNVNGNERWMMVDGNALQPTVLDWFNNDPDTNYEQCTAAWKPRGYQWIDTPCNLDGWPVCKKQHKLFGTDFHHSSSNYLYIILAIHRDHLFIYIY